MRNQRGSTTIMAVTAMLVLAVGAAGYSYSTGRNVSIASNYENGLKAQYASESAVNVAVVAGRESIKLENGWTADKPSWLKVWADNLKNSNKKLQLTLPNIGVADVECYLEDDGKLYRVQAVATTNGVSRLAYAKKVDLQNKLEDSDGPPSFTTVSTADLIRGGRISVPKYGDGTVPDNASSLYWRLPGENDKTSPALSPNSTSVYTQVMFKDLLGLPTFKPNSDGSMSTVFRINYYIRLSQYTNGATGYGIYYLAQKYFNPTKKSWDTGNPNDPRAYVVQFDPGIKNWDNGRSPSGTFLVKKVIPPVDKTANGPDDLDYVNRIPSVATAYETWDYSEKYDWQAAFQDNADVDQMHYDWGWWTFDSSDDLSTTAGANKFGTVATVPYRLRPGNYRLMFALGDMAEGNVWESRTTYGVGAKVTAGGAVLSDPSKRLVYVAQNEGTTGRRKPTFPTTVGATVVDGSVTWKAQYVPTSAEIASYILRTGVSIAKISMSDLKARHDLINGTTSVADPYTVPFTMTSKNKITIELLVDNKKNRVHIIRVNDVVVLAFNDTDTNVVPADWENQRGVTYQYKDSTDVNDLKKVVASSQLGTGIRVWGAIAEFYTADNYGQGVVTTQTVTSKIGLWGQ